MDSRIWGMLPHIHGNGRAAGMTDPHEVSIGIIRALNFLIDPFPVFIKK